MVCFGGMEYGSLWWWVCDVVIPFTAWVALFACAAKWRAGSKVWALAYFAWMALTVVALAYILVWAVYQVMVVSFWLNISQGATIDFGLGWPMPVSLLAVYGAIVIVLATRPFASTRKR